VERDVHDVVVRGTGVGPETRCRHYASNRDVIAIKFPCCGTYYPCHRCHRELADHPAKQWRTDEFDERAVLCGVCGSELSVESYLNCESTCPDCSVAFNPGCYDHRHYYFAVE
jgi:uncharacterized CHY-type Zn-finger protein